MAPLVNGPFTRLQPEVQDLLRLGAWQLMGLDRVPEYAAVNGTVETAKGVVSPKAAGLVNAVLRRLAREGARPLPPGADLATRFSHPAWLVERWVQQFGPARTAALLEHDNRPAAIHLRPTGWPADRLGAALAAAGVAADTTPHGFAVRGVRVPDLPGYDEGAFIVQDPAQAAVIAFAAVPADALVWDACAAPGGKTVALADGRRVIAGERNAHRLPRLRDTLRRAALNAPVVQADAGRPPFPSAAFDAVVLDVPCSATGTLARHPDARWRLEPAHVSRLADQQRALLAGAAETVRPGGLLVYITCSLEPEENGMQVEAFLTTHPEFRRTTADLAVFPPDAGTDGAFASRLERAR